LYNAYTPAPSTEVNRNNNQEHQQESENMGKVENMGFCCGIYCPVVVVELLLAKKPVNSDNQIVQQ
jgi:hypothetical protein